jgi:hypothetical protein
MLTLAMASPHLLQGRQCNGNEWLGLSHEVHKSSHRIINIERISI